MADKSFSMRTLARLQGRLLEILAYGALALVCFGVTRFVFGSMATEGYALLALFVCFVSSATPSLRQLGCRQTESSDLSILFTMGFRFSVLLGAAAISTATKWQHHNSFCNCLLGYYFPFLLLQSALLIRNQTFSHPPRVS
jgi:hypothetical protein